MADNGSLASPGAVWAEVVAGLRAKVHEADLDSRFRLATQGSLQDRIFHLHSGKVKLTRPTSLGRDHLLEVLGPTDTLGLNALTDSPLNRAGDSHSPQRLSPPSPPTETAREGDPHSANNSAGSDPARTWFATATTLEPVHLDWVLVADARPYLAKHPELHLELLRALNRQTEMLYQRTIAMQDIDVPGRIAAALLELMERFGQPLEADVTSQTRLTGAGGTGVRLPHGLTQLELGQMAGASRETANKVLADFIARGWIVQKRRSIVIMNEERLRYRAS